MIDGTAASGLVMPMRWAMVAVFCGPASTESWANTTLSEILVALATFSIPPGPSPLTTQGLAPLPMGMTMGLWEL